jgi:hypothetical protein
MVRPAGFEPASPRLKGEHPGPLDEGRLVRAAPTLYPSPACGGGKGGGWLEAKHAPQYAMAAELAES